MHRHLLQPLLVRASIEDALHCVGRESRAEIPLELDQEQRNALVPATAMPDRILDRHLLGGLATPEHHLDRVSDGALPGIEIVRAEAWVLLDRPGKSAL